MTQQQVKEAIDAAFRDEVSKLFANLVANLMGKVESSEEKFAAGLNFSLRAYALATTEVEKLIR